MTTPVYVRAGPGVPPGLRPAIRYTLAEVTARVGVPFNLSDAQADIGLGTDGRVRIPFDPAAWTGAPEPFVLTPDKLWASAAMAADPDLLGGIFRLLTLADEQAVTVRDAMGRFRCADLPASRRATLELPLVEMHVAELLRRLQAAGLTVPRVPAWPKALAVAITHDTDAVDFSAPSEIAYNLGKAVLRGDRVHGAMVWEGITRRQGPNPFFAFDAWADAERARQARSAFYLSHQIRVRRHLNDVRSTVFNRDVPWQRLRDLAAEGFEFGAHAAIHAKDDVEEFRAVREAIEERLRRPVFGLRHHYFSIDWRAPIKTWRKHRDAGFRYDTSIAWHDGLGFRAGTCLPYRPWDPERRSELDFYVLPTSLMDGHVIGREADPVARSCRLAGEIAAQQGLLVLDWHTETGCNAYKYAGYRATAERILDRVAPDAWCATPWEIVQRWQRRYVQERPLQDVA